MRFLLFEKVSHAVVLGGEGVPARGVDDELCGFVEAEVVEVAEFGSESGEGLGIEEAAHGEDSYVESFTDEGNGGSWGAGVIPFYKGVNEAEVGGMTVEVSVDHESDLCGQIEEPEGLIWTAWLAMVGLWARRWLHHACILYVGRR